MSTRRIAFTDGFSSETTPTTALTTSTDTDAIHDNVSGEINAIAEKVAPALADFLIIEDSADGFSKKKVEITNMPGASGENNDGLNVGSGTGKVFKSKSGLDLQFKSIAATINEITLTNGTDDVTIGLDSGIDASKIGDGSVTSTLYNQLPGVAGTGWLSGGVLSINGGDSTKYDLSAGTGVIVDRSDPTNPIYTPISWNAFTALDPTNLLTQSTTQIFINSSSAIVEVNPSDVTDADNYRDFIHVGNVIHPGTTIISIGDLKAIASGSLENSNDIMLALGPLNKKGNTYSANLSGNLTINKSSGIGFIFQTNTVNDPSDPHTATIAATTVQSFIRAFRNGTGGFTGTPGQTDVDPDQYDDGSGTLQPVPNNKYTAQRIYLNGNGSTAIQYGQNLYSTLAGAEAALDGEVFEVNPTFEQLLFRGFIITKKGTTDLTDTSVNKFITAGKFGGAGGGGGTTSTTDLQGAYLNSVDPEIILSAAPGGVSITDASSPIAASLFQVQNNARNVCFFDVDADDVTTENNLIIKNGKEFRMFDTGSSNHVGFVAPSLSTDQIYTMPALDGSANQVFTTDGSGNITWTSVGSGDVSAASNMTDHTLVRGDGGTKDVQDTGIVIDDSDNMSGIGTIASGSVTTTGDFIASLGAVGTPSHTFTGDLDTGAWSSGANIYNISTGGSERFRIDSNGDVSIGLGSDAVSKLQIHVANGSTDGMVFTSSDTGGDDQWCEIRRNNAVGGGQIHLNNGAGTTKMLLNGNTDSYMTGGGLSIGTTSMGGHIINCTGTAGLSTGTAWTNTSDVRLKDVKGDFTHGLAEIEALKPIRFRYKKDNVLELPSDIDIVGFSAQDVQKVLPEAVTEGPSGHLQLNVDPIHWAMVNAVKELARKDRKKAQLIKSMAQRLEVLEQRGK